MNILNIHGYGGSGQNTNYSILSSMQGNIDVISPTLDYLSFDPYSVECDLCQIVENNCVGLIVATSFGAFFGKQLSLKYNIPLIATNPCLRPEISLRKIAPEYFSQSNSVFVEQRELIASSAGYKTDVFIVGHDDEVIDHESITKPNAVGATFHEVEGGHKLDKDIYEEILIEEVSRHLQ